MNFLKYTKCLPLRFGRSFVFSSDMPNKGKKKINFDVSSKEFIEPILRENMKQSIPIFGISFNKAVEVGGENYSSALIKSNWKYVIDNIDSEISFIIKYIPNNLLMNSLLPGFIREKNFYEKFWPKCEKHIYLSLKDVLLFDRIPEVSVPQYYYGTPQHVVIMSDLTDEGFKMIPRRERFDNYHSKMVMESIGRLHAASLKVLQEDPSAGTQDMTVFRDEMSTIYARLYKNALNSMARQMKTWKSYERFADRLMEYAENMEKVMALRFSGDLNVRLHGDLWGNNILFRYNSFDEVEDVAFIDFQMSHWGSPAIDLLFFLNISTQKDVMFNDYDQLIHTYLTSVSTEMVRLELEQILLTKETLMNDLENAKSISVVYRLFLHIIHMYMKGEKFDFGALIVGGDSYQWRNLVKRNAPYIKELLVDLEQKKLL